MSNMVPRKPSASGNQRWLRNETGRGLGRLRGVVEKVTGRGEEEDEEEEEGRREVKERRGEEEERRGE